MTNPPVIAESPWGVSRDANMKALDVGCRVSIKRYESFADAEQLRGEWDALVERVGGDMFSSFDWLAVWWKHFGTGRRLILHVARAADELVAVLPVFAETIHWGPLGLRVVRIVGCDHCVTPCNVAIHSEWIEPVVDAWMRALKDATDWDLIHLGELPGYYGDGRALARALRESNPSDTVQLGERDYPHMVFDVPQDYESYVASLSTKERRNVRRDERSLEQRNGARSLAPHDRDEADTTFGQMIAMHQEHWNARGRLGHFAEWPGIEAFHRDFLDVLWKRNRLALVSVTSGQELEAVEYGGYFGARLHWITGARTQRSTSRVGFCALVRAAVQRGVQVIDALPGHYDYKRRLGARVLSVGSIAVVSARMRSRLRHRLFLAVTRLVSLAYHRLWFWHLAPWLRVRGLGARLRFLNKSLWRRFVRARFLVAAKPPRWREREGGTS